MRPLLFCIALLPLGLAGCTTQATLPACARVAVLELPPTPKDGSLRRVLYKEDEKPSAEALTADRERIRAALHAAVPPALAEAGFVPSIIVPETSSTPMGRPLDAAALASLQAEHPADAYMRLTITDYGETPERWKGAYITFEVVSTVAIAGALLLDRATKPVAGIYFAEESAEELGEGYAGFWTLNRLSRPVRVQADLIDGHSGKVLWQGSDTGLSRWTWGHLWRMNPATRDALLANSLQKATHELAQRMATQKAADTGCVASAHP